MRKLGGADLVVCGKQAIDGDTGQVGPELAAFLDWPQVTYVRAIREASDAALTVERLTDEGDETVWVRLPAVLTVLKDLNFPRLPSLVGRMRARHAAVETWRAADLDADPARLGLAGSPTRVVRVFTPPPRAECVLWEGEPDRTVPALVRALREKGLL